jgi:hypothetical protein
MARVRSVWVRGLAIAAAIAALALAAGAGSQWSYTPTVSSASGNQESAGRCGEVRSRMVSLLRLKLLIVRFGFRW